MFRTALIALTLALGLSAAVDAAPVRLSDLSGPSTRSLDLDGGLLSAGRGTTMRTGSVEPGTAFCLRARNGCRRGTAALTFDAPRSDIEIRTSRLARGSKAVITLYAGDRIVRRLQVTKSRTMTFSFEGITRIAFSDRSRRLGMIFAVNLPMEPAVAPVPALAGGDAVQAAVVPLPAGLPLMVAGLAGLARAGRRRVRA